jgi:hypothetical protein
MNFFCTECSQPCTDCGVTVCCYTEEGSPVYCDPCHRKRMDAKEGKKETVGEFIDKTKSEIGAAMNVPSTYWDRTDRIQESLGGRGPMCCGEPMAAADDHGRFTCFKCFRTRGF